MNTAEYDSLVDRITIKSPRATSWDDIVGNANAKEQLQEAIKASKKMGRPMPHTIIYGPPGTGKSTFASILAKEAGGYFLSTTASTLETPIDVVRMILQLNAGCENNPAHPFSTLFLDEIHMLGQAKGRQAVDQESLFTVLEDWKFFHNMMRKKFEDHNGEGCRFLKNELTVIPFTCIGATTEPGLLSDPLRRRFLVQVELQPYTQDEIALIIAGAARRLGWSITDGAAIDLSKVSRRNPGTSLILLTSANARAVATDRSIIDEQVASEVIGRMGLYPLGLNETDVRILKILYERPKGVGMAELSRAVGISVSQFSGLIEPYLRLLGFIETLTRRSIRQEGVTYLASIGKVAA